MSWIWTPTFCNKVSWFSITSIEVFALKGEYYWYCCRVESTELFRSVSIVLNLHVFQLWEEGRPQLVCRFEPSIYLLWGDSTNHSNTVLHWFIFHPIMYHLKLLLRPLVSISNIPAFKKSVYDNVSKRSMQPLKLFNCKMEELKFWNQEVIHSFHHFITLVFT